MDRMLDDLIEKLDYWGNIGLVAICVVAVVALIVVLFKFRDTISDLVHNRIAGGWRTRASGIIFGRRGFQRVKYSPEGAEGHVLVLGGTGKGKTSALLVPTIRSITGTTFAIDISGDISLKAEKPNAIILEPGSGNAIYNVFADVDEAAKIGDAEKYEALHKLAYQLIPARFHTSDAGAFFEGESRRMLMAILIADYDRGLDFYSICRTCANSSWRDLIDYVVAADNPRANAFIKTFSGVAEKNNAACKQNLDASLSIFETSETVQKMLGRKSFDSRTVFSPADIETKSCFLVIPKHLRATYAPLMHLITAQMLDYMNRRPKSENNILLALDEFAALGHLDITDALRGIRKNRVRILICTQGLADLDLIYGRDERRIIIDNCKYRVLMDVGDADDQEYFARMIGKRYRRDRDGRETERWIVRPNRLGRLGNTLLVLHPTGYIRVRYNFYWRTWW